MEISLEPFELDGDQVATSIRLDSIALPTVQPELLAGKTFEFPADQDEPGWIDGSVCIQHSHHPVDVTSISFEKGRNGELLARLEATLRFEYEGLADYADTSVTLVSPLRFEDTR